MAATIQRSTVLAASFALLQASTAFVSASRRLAPWNQTIGQPAVFQRLVTENWEQMQGYGQPQMVTMSVEIWVYVRNGGPDDNPEDSILPLLDAVDDALNSNTTYDGRQCLGLEGFVQHAWREGETHIAQGEQTDQSILIIPYKILVSGSFSAAT